MTELARRMNYTPAYIGILERGGNAATVAAMMSLARAMDMRLSELFRMFEDEQSAIRAAAEKSAPQ